MDYLSEYLQSICTQLSNECASQIYYHPNKKLYVCKICGRQSLYRELLEVESSERLEVLRRLNKEE